MSTVEVSQAGEVFNRGILSQLSLLLSTAARLPDMVQTLASEGKLNRRELKKSARHRMEFEEVYAHGLEGRYKYGRSKQSFQELRSEFEKSLSAEDWSDLWLRIEHVWQEYEFGFDEALGSSETAFLIHQRTTDEHIRHGQGYGDAAAFGPQLRRLVENAPDSDLLATHLVNNLPPFRAAMTHYANKEGRQITGSVVCIPVDINALTQTNVSRDAMEDMYARVLLGARFLKKVGVRHAGLGAVLPKISRYGESMRMMIEKECGESEEFLTTSGHGMTVALMIESMYDAAARYDVSVEGSKIAVVGCGVIGKAFSNVLYTLNSRPHPSEIILADVIKSQSEALKAQLEQTKYGKNIKISIVELNNSNFDSVIPLIARDVDIMIGAATSSHQVALERSIDSKKQLIVVDDSQPTLIQQCADKGSVHIIWPTGVTPIEEYHRDEIAVSRGSLTTNEASFNYGPRGLAGSVIDGKLHHGLWGCEAEQLILSRRGLMGSNAVRSNVTPEIAQSMLDLLNTDPHIKTDPGALQSYGKLI